MATVALFCLLTALLAGGPARADDDDEGGLAIAGPAVVGATLTATAPSGQAADGPYKWLRCRPDGGKCKGIDGATAQTYVAGAEDAGAALRVQGSGKGGRSEPTAAIATLSPAVRGVPQVGQVLTADLGQPLAAGVAYRYQWFACRGSAEACDTIATGPTYRIQPADAGSRLRFEVGVAALVGSLATSRLTDPVAAPPPAPPPPPASGGGTPAPSPSPDPPPAQGGSPPPAQGGSPPPAPGGQGTAGGSPSPVPAPTPATPSGPAVPSRTPAVRRPRLLRPFPVVRFAGRFAGARTTFTIVSVRSARGVRIAYRCTGRACRFRGVRTVTARGRLTRLRALERTYPAGTVIEIRVTRSGRLGKYARIVTRRAAAPSRRDACALFTRRHAVACTRA